MVCGLCNAAPARHRNLCYGYTVRSCSLLEKRFYRLKAAFIIKKPVRKQQPNGSDARVWQRCCNSRTLRGETIARAARDPQLRRIGAVGARQRTGTSRGDVAYVRYTPQLDLDSVSACSNGMSLTDAFHDVAQHRVEQLLHARR